MLASFVITHTLLINCLFDCFYLYFSALYVKVYIHWGRLGFDVECRTQGACRDGNGLVNHCCKLKVIANDKYFEEDAIAA